MSENRDFQPSTERIPLPEWTSIVEHVPIVSVDLLVVYDGSIVLGKRQNEPAKGEWFVPGGRVHKHERLEAAVHRVAREELGVTVTIQERLGVYEHLYHDAEIEGVNGKHYLANGFVVEAEERPEISDDQHEQIRLFDSLPDSLHEYVQAYIEDAGTLPDQISVTD